MAISAFFGLPANPAAADATNIITTYASDPTAQFSWPTDVTVSPSGEVFASSWAGSKIQKVASNGTTTTVVGTGIAGCTTDATDGISATSAQIMNTNGISFDHVGNMYFAAAGCYRVYKVDTNNIIHVFAGKGADLSDGDGGQAVEAGIRFPIATAVDSQGNVYITEHDGHRVRKVAPNGVISTFTGTGTPGTTGHNVAATSASINGPWGITTDNHDNVYVTERFGHVVRKITPAGIITTIAGQPGVSGPLTFSGLAADSYLVEPEDVEVDPLGNIFIASNSEGANPNDHGVNRIDTAGNITVFAGTGPAGSPTDGQPANTQPIDSVSGLALHQDGSLFMSSWARDAIYKVTNAVFTTSDAQVVATVNPLLSFTVAGRATSCNGATLSSGSSSGPTSVALGSVSALANGVGAQTLTTETNAGNGFVVYVRSAGQMTSAAGHVIAHHSPTNASPGAFGAAGAERFGYTTDDSSLVGGTATRFTASGPLWAGLSATNSPVSSGTGPGSKTSCVAFQMSAAAATPAGAYSVAITYTVVPAF